MAQFGSFAAKRCASSAKIGATCRTIGCSITDGNAAALVRATKRHCNTRTSADELLAGVHNARSSVTPRREFRRTRAVPDSAAHKTIFQFSVIGRTTQHQSTATHISTSHEIDREQQSVVKYFQKQIDVFASGDTAQE